MRSLRVFVVPSLSSALLVALAACSSDPGVPAPSPTYPSPAASATTYATPTPPAATPTPTAASDAGAPRADGGADAGHDGGLRTSDGGKPSVPPANLACRDLTACCQKIQSTIERAACLGVAVSAKPSTCATALIGYQLVGCGHSPFSLGTPSAHDQDGNGEPDWLDPSGDPDVSLEDYCATYPEDVDTCSDVSGTDTSGYDSDPCVADPSAPECQTDPFAGDPDYSGDPSGDYSGDPSGGSSGSDTDPFGGGDDFP